MDQWTTANGPRMGVDSQDRSGLFARTQRYRRDVQPVGESAGGIDADALNSRFSQYYFTAEGTLRNERFPLLQGDLVNGRGSTDIHAWPQWVEKTVNFSITDLDTTWIYADATAGNITITLPSGPDSRRLIGVKKIDATANTVTIDSGTGNKIDGAQTKVLAASMAFTQVQSVGLRGGFYQWWIVSS